MGPGQVTYLLRNSSAREREDVMGTLVDMGTLQPAKKLPENLVPDNIKALGNDSGRWPEGWQYQ